MAKLSTTDIRKVAIEIIRENPGGIRFTALKRAILDRHPETLSGTIDGTVWNLEVRHPREVTKPSRGLYLPADGVAPEAVANIAIQKEIQGRRIKEDDFYEPFADWLKNELDEATTAVAWGGASMQKKWGTPDVVGVYKPLASHRIRFEPELVAAEIKIDPQQPVVAFGQAAAYRLFAAKSYIVMPTALTEEDYSRLEALCMLFGIGLVLFDLNPEDPNFQIRVRAQRFPPDMFYVNEFAERLFQLDPATFNKLFG